MRIAVFSLVALLGCTQAPPQPEPVPGVIEGGTPVFTVNGSPVTEEMVEAVLKRLPPEATEQLAAMPEARQQFDERLIVGELLYKQALERGIDKTEAGQLAVALAAREVLAAEVIEVVGAEAVTDQALKDWYDQHQVQFRRPSAKVSHILLKDAAEAEKIAGMARAGGDFAQLAREHSVDRTSAAEGGELGWLDKGRLLPALDTAVFGAELGQGTGPVESTVGYHILLVGERRDVTPLDAVRDQVESAVRNEAVDAYIATLRGEAVVERADAGGADAAAVDVNTAAPAGGPGPAPKGKAKAGMDEHGHPEGSH